MHKTHDDQASVSKSRKAVVHQQEDEALHLETQDQLELLIALHKQLAEYQHDNRVLQNKLNQHHKYKDFYELAFPVMELLEPTPDLKSDMEAIPNQYKLLIREYIKITKDKLVAKVMGEIENPKHIIIMNGITVGLNKLDEGMERFVTPESKEHISMVTRKPIPKKK